MSQESAEKAVRNIRRRTRRLRRAASADLEDWALVGEPEQVAEGVARYREKLGMTHLIVRAGIPGVPRAEIEASLELLPSLGDL